MIGDIVCKRYKITKLLGTGGMATVWLAEDIILNRNVAIKVFKIDIDDENLIRRFYREANSVTSLSHENIVSIYGVNNENNLYFLILEYVEGQTLKEFMNKNENIPLSTVINIFIQLSEALYHAHQNGIIHRDIKPQNILITSDFVCKITDFGISRSYIDTTITQTNQMLGTAYYISPEQAKGKLSIAQSDIYSLGILLFEMLAGTVPFKGESAISIVLKHLEDDIPNIDKYRSGVPHSLKNIILKSTMKNPADRYKNASEFKNDLLTSLDTDRMYEKIKNVSEHKKYNIENKWSEEKYNSKYSNISSVDNKSNIKKSKGIYGIIITIFSFFLLILSATFIYNNYFYNTVVMPNVKDVEIDLAKKTILDSGLNIGSVTIVPNEKVLENNVISSDPISGKKLKKGSLVNLKVSSGKNTIIVPNYLGMTASQLKEQLDKIGYKKIIFEYTYSEEYDYGVVINQSIALGSEIIPNENIITITISKGSKGIVVPNILNKNIKEAYEEIYSLGLNVGNVFEEYDEKVEKDIVIKQSIPHDSTVKKGTKINLTISKGSTVSEEYIDIDLVGKNLDYANIIAKENNLKLEIVYELNNEIEPNFVIKQTTTNSGKIKKGDTIILTVAKKQDDS